MPLPRFFSIYCNSLCAFSVVTFSVQQFLNHFLEIVCRAIRWFPHLTNQRTYSLWYVQRWLVLQHWIAYRLMSTPVSICLDRRTRCCKKPANVRLEAFQSLVLLKCIRTHSRWHISIRRCTVRQQQESCSKAINCFFFCGWFVSKVKQWAAFF